MSEYSSESEYLSQRQNTKQQVEANSKTVLVATGRNVNHKDLVAIILPAIALGLTSFLPWISIRLPGLEHKYLSLNGLSGGRLLFGLVSGLLIIGIPLSISRFRTGSILIAFGVALFGWFAGLATLTIGVIRSLIPDIALAGFDITDGLIGQGPGVVLAIGSAIVLSAELCRWFIQAEGGTRQNSLYGLVSLAVVIGLSMANHSRWVVVDSDSVNGQIAISGDSLFGSVVISLLTWIACAFAAGQFAGIEAAKSRVLAVLMIVVAIFKSLQLLVVWAGTSFVDWVLPSRVGSIVKIDLSGGFFISVIFCFATLCVAIIGIISPAFAEHQIKLRPIALMPSVLLLIATISITIFFNPEETKSEVVSDTTEITIESSSSLPAAVENPKLESGDTDSDGMTLSDSDFTLSTAFVVIADANDGLCASGSGAFIGDGTYVVTNNHVVTTGDLPADCSRLWVGFGADPSTEPDSWYPANVIWSDFDDDLAILKVAELMVRETRPLEIVYDRLGLGDEVSIYGFPGIGGETLTLTKGLVSGFDKKSGDFYKVSAAINAGNSGGPVLDAQGRLVGIATAVIRSEISCENSQTCYTDGTNVGLVRPIDVARSAIKEYVP